MPPTAPATRNHEPLGQHLAHDPPLPRAERRADRELAVAAGGAHQQQVGDVRAGDEQHEQDAALQHVQRRADIADQLVADRNGEAAELAASS